LPTRCDDVAIDVPYIRPDFDPFSMSEFPMRRPLIVGNWKMNLSRAGARELAPTIKQGLAASPRSDVDVAVCPASVFLADVGARSAGANVGVRVQIMYFKAGGAFTGETAQSMRLVFGCRFVILGHSARRQFFRECDAHVLEKTKPALAAGLTPIV